MALWTDVIDPETLSGFARRSLSEYEAQKGTLARWLPNHEVADAVVRFIAGGSGLVEEARYRAFDAEPEFGKQPKYKRVTVDLPPLSQQGAISERDQVRLRNADDEVRTRILTDATRNAVRAVADRSERQRGAVLVSGAADISQDNYSDSYDYGRDASMSVTASTLWNASADILDDLQTWVDHYSDVNGEAPGALVTSSRVARILSQDKAFAVSLAGGGSRPGSRDDVNGILAGVGLPEITVYDRRTSSGRVIPDDRLLFLPAPVDPTAGESELGATFWGQTLASQEPTFEIAESEQPGIVAAAFTNDGIPPIKHTFVDSLTLPVGANMDLSFVAKVL